MAAEYPNSRKSNTQILQELEDLSESLYQTHVTSTTTRRTASLVLPREAVPPIEVGPDKDGLNLNPKPRSRRMSLSPWRSRPKMDTEDVRLKDPPVAKPLFSDADTPTEKKGIWKWKPIRALSHIGMQKLSCLFSVEVVAAQGLPASMNGLRLAVCVRKKDSREGGVQTMPSRVSQGAADFEETLFIRSHVYYTPATATGSGTPMKFEPRPFLIYVAAVDADELDFGKKTVDLSGLIQESIEKNFQGTRIRQWDTTFSLSGKAKGGELVLKLGFQIMEKDGGSGIYSQAEAQRLGKSRTHSPSVARKHSKSSFSVPSPRMTSRPEKGAASQDLAMDHLNLDEPAPPPPPPPPVHKPESDDNDILDFEVEDKGVEIQNEEDEQSEESSDKRSVSSEVVKEVVQDQSHLTRLNELDSIAQQIKALESLMGDEKTLKVDEETASSQALDADEDKVTREFLSMLEAGENDADSDSDSKFEDARTQPLKLDTYEEGEGAEAQVFLPDLGKGLGCVVQTRYGGYLAAANPFNALVGRKETPKLAMQMSKPMVIQSDKAGFEVFQKMAALGLEKLSSELLSSMAMDELSGKTAEQVAFEGIASAIIQGRRSEEGAKSSAARTIAAVKSMANMMSSGRRERVSSGIWNVSEEAVTVDYILGFSLQKIEAMAVEALKIQADISKEEPPFDVSPLDGRSILDSAVAIEEWINAPQESEAITVAVLVQLRDPIRQFEAVGGPMVALMHAAACNEGSEDGERRYKVSSLQVGGVKVRSGGVRTGWDTEKQRLTALQWLVAHGVGKAGGKKGRRVVSKGPDVLWSISSRVMADMWLKPIRNPDVKFNTK